MSREYERQKLREKWARQKRNQRARKAGQGQQDQGDWQDDFYNQVV